MATTAGNVERGQKRRREDSTGTAVSVPPQNPVPGPAMGQATVVSLKIPLGWQTRASALNPTNIPPPMVLERFVALYADALSGYRKAVKAHHAHSGTRDRYLRETDGGVIPPEVSRMLRVPSAYNFPSSIGTAGVNATKEARETLEKAVLNAQQAMTVYTRACHEQAVQLLSEQIDIERRKERLVEDLAVYSADILVQGGSPSTTLWNVFIEAGAEALGEELLSIRFDTMAQVLKERNEQAAKAALVATTNADAEMTDGTRPVAELVDEAVQLALEKRLKDMQTISEKEAKKSKSKPQPAPPATSESKQSSSQAKATPASGSGNAAEGKENAKSRKISKKKKKGTKKDGAKNASD